MFKGSGRARVLGLVLVLEQVLMLVVELVQVLVLPPALSVVRLVLMVPQQDLLLPRVVPLSAAVQAPVLRLARLPPQQSVWLLVGFGILTMLFSSIRLRWSSNMECRQSRRRV